MESADAEALEAVRSVVTVILWPIIIFAVGILLMDPPDIGKKKK